MPHAMADMADIESFLALATPGAWIEAALTRQADLLVDHANCEKKAAASALSLMFRYVDRPTLLMKMSRLAREELRHFEQVLAVMEKRAIAYGHLSASRYAEGLRRLVRKREPDRLIDLLVVGAFIEARSCERFARLAPHLDDELGAFYSGLLRSEARHFRDYLELARRYADGPIDDRIAVFRAAEAELIGEADPLFRFHGGPPV